MATLESQRHLLEELEVLQVATAQRFRKNPALGQHAHIHELDLALESAKKRPHKETLLQQHELKLFGQQTLRNSARAASNFELGHLKEEIEKLKDPQANFLEFEKQLAALGAKHRDTSSQGGAPSQTLTDFYRIYLSGPADEKKESRTKRKYFLSSAGAHLGEQAGSKFNEVEMYGRFLDLSLYYEMFKLATSSLDSYIQYLQTLADFPSLNTSAAYLKYLEALLSYLRTAFENSHPLDEKPEIVKEEESSGAQEDGTPNEKGEVFCKACDKLFSKETVYKGHLQGKKHKKNAAAESSRNKESGDAVSKNAKASVSPLKLLQSEIKSYIQALQSEVAATIQDHERRSALTDRERMLEVLAVEGEESEFTSEETDSEGDNDEDNDDDFYSKDLPLGTDGTPIPLWLFKLQGLHRTYQCEICGNAIYKGRQQYTKHFGLPKHVHGLMCLGIPEQDVWSFNNISTIEDAQKLWRDLRKSRLEKQHDVENTVEVEDDDGNVMSHKDYIELKRQGLL